MDGKETESVNNSKYVDKTVLQTPKPTACSTVNKKSFKKKEVPKNMDLENSLGILDVSDYLQRTEKNETVNTNMGDLSYHLEQQRLLANNSLQRANRVGGLPSKYLRPSTNDSSISRTTESIVSESDLTRSPPISPKDTSTPRTSVQSNDCVEKDWSRLSLGQSMAQLSYQIGNTDISIDNFVKEFHRAMKTIDKSDVQVDSQLFSPGEEAASRLLADEMSWRRQNEIPVSTNFSQVSNENVSCGEVSVGAFFQQRSDSISEFKMARSPVKSKKPVPLIDTVTSFTEEEDEETKKKTRKSLSISLIQKLLAESEDTPRKVTSYLLKQGQKLSETDGSSLALSKDSSYTSNYSDNEAMKQIVAEKENIDIHNVLTEQVTPSVDRPLSASSTRSSSTALSELPDGKLPIESTKTELIWGCVKVDKCVTQEFLLRNRTSKRLCLQMSTRGYDFKIRKDNRQESEPLSAAKILLHPHESRAVIVSYIPTKIGAAVDELSFTSLDPKLQQTKKQSVRLFGYGGFGKINILNLTKDVTGKFWLSLGKLDHHNVITHKFTIRNAGTLPCFAYIHFTPKELFGFTNVSISPNFPVLLPNQEKEITFTFILTVEDHQVLQRCMFPNTMVAEMGSLLVISGTEVNRGRLRRQCRKYSEKGLEIDALSNKLKEKVQGESMPNDLNAFKEATGSLKDILKLFTRSEVVVTIEQDPEVTIMPQYLDESGMFHTLCQESTVMRFDTTATQNSCKLEPSSIILTPPTKMRDVMFLISESDKMMQFEVVCEPEGLEIFPKEGILSPRQEVVINVTCSQSSAANKDVFKVLVYVDNDVLEASIKITFLPLQSKRKPDRF